MLCVCVCVCVCERLGRNRNGALDISILIIITAFRDVFMPNHAYAPEAGESSMLVKDSSGSPGLGTQSR